MSEENGDARRTLAEAQARMRHSIGKARKLVERTRALLLGHERDGDPA